MRSAFAALCICGAAVIGALWQWYPRPSIVLHHDGSSTSVTISHTGGPVIVDAVPMAPRLWRVITYDDPRFARGRGMSDRFANGLAGHVRAALAYRGIDVDVYRVDALGLDNWLLADPRGVCVVIPGGILPDGVRSPGRDALHRFVVKGGLVIWAGAPFDAFYSSMGTGGAPPTIHGPDVSAWPQLFAPRGPIFANADPRSPQLRFAARAAPLQAATGLTFTATTFSVDARRLTSAGGSALAYIDDRGDSSVSELPIGRGRVVIFGDAFDGELQAAAAIAQVIATGAWFDPRGLHVAAVVDASHPDAAVALPRGTHAFAFGAAPYYFPFGY